ncbi:MAG: molybdate ABC transporter substrate-binding protein [Pseudomonadota bacterium]
MAEPIGGRRGTRTVWGVVLCLALLWPAWARSAEVSVAVAANFAEVLARLGPEFERRSGHTLAVSVGSTGTLYAQIRRGAPFDVFLAADRQRPARLEAEGDAVAGSRFTYARGRLALWSRDPDRIHADGARTLRAGGFRRLAMPNPELAPYGAAARETLEALGVYGALRERIVMGQNVGQAHALVATGNAELGFVAVSALHGGRREATGSRWVVPQALHSPIRQDAVLLNRARDDTAARALLDFLQTADARAVIREVGYAVP